MGKSIAELQKLLESFRAKAALLQRTTSTLSDQIRAAVP